MANVNFFQLNQQYRKTQESNHVVVEVFYSFQGFM